jgi:hypothetical protein
LVSLGIAAFCPRSFATWPASSAKTNRLAESSRMYAHSSAVDDGYTVVVAPPAHRMPRSISTHS